MFLFLCISYNKKHQTGKSSKLSFSKTANSRIDPDRDIFLKSDVFPRYTIAKTRVHSSAKHAKRHSPSYVANKGSNLALGATYSQGSGYSGSASYGYSSGSHQFSGQVGYSQGSGYSGSASYGYSSGPHSYSGQVGYSQGSGYTGSASYGYSSGSHQFSGQVGYSQGSGLSGSAGYSGTFGKQGQHQLSVQGSYGKYDGPSASVKYTYTLHSKKDKKPTSQGISAEESRTVSQKAYLEGQRKLLQDTTYNTEYCRRTFNQGPGCTDPSFTTKMKELSKYK